MMMSRYIGIDESPNRYCARIRQTECAGENRHVVGDARAR
jgi:hypothetical protein